MQAALGGSPPPTTCRSSRPGCSGSFGTGRPTISELAGFLELDKSSVTGLVDRAEERGLVTRIASAARPSQRAGDPHRRPARSSSTRPGRLRGRDRRTGGRPDARPRSRLSAIASPLVAADARRAASAPPGSRPRRPGRRTARRDERDASPDGLAELWFTGGSRRAGARPRRWAWSARTQGSACASFKYPAPRHGPHGR